MATILPVVDIVDVGDVSTYLSANYTSKRALFGGSIIKPQPPVQIAYITDALRWGLSGASQSNENNRQMANYLYWLCGIFQLQAQNIIYGPGGGSVAPTPSGTGAVNDIDFIVSGTTFIPTGATSVAFDGTGGRPDLRGYNIDFFRSGQPMYTTPQADGALYYNWNKATGVLQLLGTLPEAVAGEPMRISPDSGAAANSASALATSVTVLPAAWADAITLNLQYIVDAGEVALFVSGYNSNFLVAPTNFIYTSTGIIIQDVGFDSANFPFTLIMKIN